MKNFTKNVFNAVRNSIGFSSLGFPFSQFSPLIKPINKRFYSTSLPFHSPDKLFINSTPDNIVFMDYNDNTQRSVLILPSLKPFIDVAYFEGLTAEEMLLMNKELSMNLKLELDNLHLQLYNIFYNLESGTYKLDFFIYYEDLSNVNAIKEVYNSDFFNKNELNKL